MTGPRRLGALAAALTVLAAASARGGPIEWAAEVRAAGSAAVASVGQFGSDDPAERPCGDQPIFDGGGQVGATVAGVIQGRTHRYQLSLSGGYVALRCTPLLRRPVFALDYRGEHSFHERTRVSSAAHVNVDVFDRTLDLRTGMLAPGDTPPQDPGKAAGAPIAGTHYLLGQASLDVQHLLPGRLGRHGLRAGVEARVLQLLEVERAQSEYSTLGSMLTGAISLGWFLDRPSGQSRGRIEVPLRYRVSQFDPATYQGVATRWQIAPAHDLDGRVHGEYRPQPSWTLTGNIGLAGTYQPQLCAALDPQLVAEDRCSIDSRAPGIRGTEGPPKLELLLGRRGTLAPVGELGAAYATPKQRFELRLQRSYEPDPYAGALSLGERVLLDLWVRPTPTLFFYGGVQLMHIAESSPARVTPVVEPTAVQLLSPQNRTVWLMQGLLGVDYVAARPLALFAELSGNAMAIRGEAVSSTDRSLEIGAFPVDAARDATAPRYQSTARLQLLVGLRLVFESTQRERDLLLGARTAQ